MGGWGVHFEKKKTIDNFGGSLPQVWKTLRFLCFHFFPHWVETRFWATSTCLLSTRLPNPLGSKRASACLPVNTDQTFHPLNSALLTLAERREQGASASASAAKKFWHEKGGAQFTLGQVCRMPAVPCSSMQNHHLSDKAGVKTRRCLSRSWILPAGMHFEILTTISCKLPLPQILTLCGPSWSTVQCSLSEAHWAHCTQSTLCSAASVKPLSTSPRQNYFLPLITLCNNFQFSVYFRSSMMYKKLILKARYITT